MPARGVLAEIGGGDLRPGALDRLQPLQIERERRILVGDGVDQHARQLGRLPLLGKAVEGEGALAEPVEQPGVAQKLQVTRDARLALAQDLGQFGHRQFAMRAERQQPQPRGLGRRLQRRQQIVHRLMSDSGQRGVRPAGAPCPDSPDTDIKISLCVVNRFSRTAAIGTVMTAPSSLSARPVQGRKRQRASSPAVLRQSRHNRRAAAQTATARAGQTAKPVLGHETVEILRYLAQSSPRPRSHLARVEDIRHRSLRLWTGHAAIRTESSPLIKSRRT